MKKFLAAIVAVLVVTAAVATVFASSYVGNANSKKFHVASCSFAERMKPANRVEFQSRDEAISAGYVPCKRCKP